MENDDDDDEAMIKDKVPTVAVEKNERWYKIVQTNETKKIKGKRYTRSTNWEICVLYLGETVD